MPRKLTTLLLCSTLLTLSSAAYGDGAGKQSQKVPLVTPTQLHAIERSAHLGYGPNQYRLGLLYAAGDAAPATVFSKTFPWLLTGGGKQHTTWTRPHNSNWEPPTRTFGAYPKIQPKPCIGGNKPPGTDTARLHEKRSIS